MEISLIRHGKSQLTENDKITFADFKKWVEKYDLNGVFEESAYPEVTIEKVATAKVVVTSHLKRSIVSANLLNPNTKTISDPLFRETELPAKPTILFNVKLKPNNWAVFLRLLWFSGYSNKCESLSQAKLRAKKASQQLIGYANEHKSIVLIGHGFFNMLIAKELKKMGWKGKRNAGAKHWNCTTYSLFN
ncbi:histidine phosphatase family protein [Alkalihalophilus lindianensis]|uniref:Histidine phosphatase family protein n=1 Tax=Alkalihalophilus lindianensis TaxID=1630542 RepID=A0ABU3X816_9BACI|nr:histidine phosphatase family protein [Alkalihalophilus lindianensis]MDV2684041.1 histidine phosphatase family protein [Alkalihalophilus lindianensis]